jgi:hypothetical protein
VSQLTTPTVKAGKGVALQGSWRFFDVLMRFKESVKVRLWGRELHSFKKGEVHNVSMAVVGVLLAQGFAEPVASPPIVPQQALARTA